MDVVDLEATYRFSGCRTDVVVAGGVRAAGLGIQYTVWNAQTDLLGLTAATDVRTLLCSNCGRSTSFVYGGRLAILGGDINGGTQGLVRDMNWRVWEAYVGVEQRCCVRGMNLYSRLAFEIQNWHGDDMIGEVPPLPATPRKTSLGFLGPSVQLGATF